MTTIHHSVPPRAWIGDPHPDNMWRAGLIAGAIGGLVGFAIDFSRANSRWVELASEAEVAPGPAGSVGFGFSVPAR